MFLPEKMRIPSNLRDPIATHTNLNLHASIICLHHASIEKVDKYHLPDTIKQTSLYRLKSSAEAIVNIIKVTSHTSANFVCNFFSFSLQQMLIPDTEKPTLRVIVILRHNSLRVSRETRSSGRPHNH